MSHSPMMATEIIAYVSSDNIIFKNFPKQNSSLSKCIVSPSHVKHHKNRVIFGPYLALLGKLISTIPHTHL